MYLIHISDQFGRQDYGQMVTGTVVLLIILILDQVTGMVVY